MGARRWNLVRPLDGQEVEACSNPFQTHMVGIYCRERDLVEHRDGWMIAWGDVTKWRAVPQSRGAPNDG